MTTEEKLTVTDEDFELTEEEINALIGNTFETPEPSPERIESVLKRAKLEVLAKTSADFVVDSFGTGLKGITDALIGMTEKDPKPRPRSY